MRGFLVTGLTSAQLILTSNQGHQIALECYRPRSISWEGFESKLRAPVLGIANAALIAAQKAVCLETLRRASYNRKWQFCTFRYVQ